MNQACTSIIRMDRCIRFVATVDQNGRLLVGQSRSILSNSITERPVDNVKRSTHTTNSKIDDLVVEVFLKHKNMYLFYSDYLLGVIENFRVHQENDNGLAKSDSYFSGCIDWILPHFEISEYGKKYDEDVKLVIVPLKIRRHTFLCIYY